MERCHSSGIDRSGRLDYSFNGLSSWSYLCHFTITFLRSKKLPLLQGEETQNCHLHLCIPISVVVLWWGRWEPLIFWRCYFHLCLFKADFIIIVVVPFFLFFSFLCFLCMVQRLFFIVIRIIMMLFLLLKENSIGKIYIILQYQKTVASKGSEQGRSQEIYIGGITNSLCKIYNNFFSFSFFCGGGGGALPLPLPSSVFGNEPKTEVRNKEAPIWEQKVL